MPTPISLATPPQVSVSQPQQPTDPSRYTVETPRGPLARENFNLVTGLAAVFANTHARAVTKAIEAQRAYVASDGQPMNPGRLKLLENVLTTAYTLLVHRGTPQQQQDLLVLWCIDAVERHTELLIGNVAFIEIADRASSIFLERYSGYRIKAKSGGVRSTPSPFYDDLPGETGYVFELTSPKPQVCHVADLVRAEHWHVFRATNSSLLHQIRLLPHEFTPIGSQSATLESLTQHELDELVASRCPWKTKEPFCLGRQMQSKLINKARQALREGGLLEFDPSEDFEPQLREPTTGALPTFNIGSLVLEYLGDDEMASMDPTPAKG